MACIHEGEKGKHLINHNLSAILHAVFYCPINIYGLITEMDVIESRKYFMP